MLYYYYKNDKAQGPHSLAELQQLHDTGAIDADTRISYEGAEAWITYEKLCKEHGIGDTAEQETPQGEESAAAPIFPAEEGVSVENACPHCTGALTIADDQLLPLYCPGCQKQLRAKDDGLWEQFLFSFSSYASFRGRATRREFWSFTLIVILLWLPISMMGMSGVFGLAVLLPSYAVMARRLHDIELSGWWVLPIKLLPSLCVTGAVSFYLFLVHQAFGSLQTAWTLIVKYLELKDKLEGLQGITGFLVRQQVEKMEQTIVNAFVDPFMEHVAIYVVLMVVVPLSCLIFGLVACCRDSQPGVNKYGISPKYPLGKK